MLVIGSEVYSRILDWQDRGTCVLFGDGAGAVFLRAGVGAGTGERPRHPLHPSACRRLARRYTLCGWRGRAAGAVRASEDEGQAKCSAMPCCGSPRRWTRRWPPTGSTARRWTGWCRTRRTCASSRASANASTCRWRGWCAPSSGTPIPPPPRSRWRSPRPMPTGGCSRGQLVLLEALGGGLTWGSALVRL